jgi:hypothetical protein
MMPFAIDNVQRFTFAGAVDGAFRGDPAAGIRAGERKTLYVDITELPRSGLVQRILSIPATAGH